jgi:ornithine cyclodeaminase/alanine dehydrogenase-like protein (mu-crystallin family)
MAELMNKNFVAGLLLAFLLSACAGKAPQRPQEPEVAAPVVRTPEQLRINELERVLADKQRHCLEEKRRLDAAIKEGQKKAEDLQKKLDALLAIDRDLRSRNKAW